MRWGRRSPGQARGGSDLEPGPRAAQEGGLAGRGPPLQGVQDPVLLKLGDVLQGVPGAVTGGSGECGLVGAVAPTVRGPLPARPSASHQGWGPQGSGHSLPEWPSLPLTQGQDSGGLLGDARGAQAAVRQHSLLVSVAPLLGGRVQVEELGRPGHQALLTLPGPLPLRLLQGKLLPCGLVLVALADGPGDVLPEPACAAPALSQEGLGSLVPSH